MGTVRLVDVGFSSVSVAYDSNCDAAGVFHRVLDGSGKSLSVSVAMLSVLDDIRRSLLAIEAFQLQSVQSLRDIRGGGDSSPVSAGVMSHVLAHKVAAPVEYESCCLLPGYSELGARIHSVLRRRGLEVCGMSRQEAIQFLRGVTWESLFATSRCGVLYADRIMAWIESLPQDSTA